MWLGWDLMDLYIKIGLILTCDQVGIFASNLEIKYDLVFKISVQFWYGYQILLWGAIVCSWLSSKLNIMYHWALPSKKRCSLCDWLGSNLDIKSFGSRLGHHILAERYLNISKLYQENYCEIVCPSWRYQVMVEP